MKNRKINGITVLLKIVFQQNFALINTNILLKLRVFNAISVTKTVLVQFPTFSNAKGLSKALNFEKCKIHVHPLGFQKNIIAQCL